MIAEKTRKVTSLSAKDSKVKKDVYTPLGHGKIVYILPDSTFVVQFDWGGGHIFHPSELSVEEILRDIHGIT